MWWFGARAFLTVFVHATAKQFITIIQQILNLLQGTLIGILKGFTTEKPRHQLLDEDRNSTIFKKNIMVDYYYVFARLSSSTFLCKLNRSRLEDEQLDGGFRHFWLVCCRKQFHGAPFGFTLYLIGLLLILRMGNNV